MGHYKKYGKTEKTTFRIVSSVACKIAGTSLGITIGAAAAAAGTVACGAAGSYVGGKIAREITYDSDDEREEAAGLIKQGIDYGAGWAVNKCEEKFLEKGGENVRDKYLTDVAKGYAGVIAKNITEKAPKIYGSIR